MNININKIQLKHNDNCQLLGVFIKNLETK